MRRRTCPRTSRRTSRACQVLARLLGAGVLLGTAAACAADRAEPPRGFPEAAVDEATLPARPAAPALTDARARSALLREGDLGGAWSDTQGAATWRDGLLKGRTDRPECQELLDAFYAEDLFGTPRGGRAVTGFDDYEYGSQLRYQVGAYDGAQVDERLNHFRRLADECREFTVTGFGDREYAAQVTPVDLPGGIGDAREGLRLVVSGEVDGEEGALTFDLATVRVGDTAVLVTQGGLYGIDDAATREAARAGAERLQQVLGGKKTEKGEKGERATEPDEAEGGREEQGAEGTGREETGEVPDEYTDQGPEGDVDGSAEEFTEDGDTGSADSDDSEFYESHDSSDGYRDEARATSPSGSA